jgi:Na+-driven multidrug efflux pump
MMETFLNFNQTRKKFKFSNFLKKSKNQKNQKKIKKIKKIGTSMLPPAYRRLAVMLFPLAVRMVTMRITDQVLAAVLARGRDPEVALATFGIAFYVTAFLSSPLREITQLPLALWGKGAALVALGFELN